MALTYEEQLTQVQTAMTQLMSGAVQSYSISTPTGSRAFTMLDFAALQKWEKELRGLIERQSRGGIRIIGATPV